MSMMRLAVVSLVVAASLRRLWQVRHCASVLCINARQSNAIMFCKGVHSTSTQTIIGRQQWTGTDASVVITYAFKSPLFNRHAAYICTCLQQEYHGTATVPEAETYFLDCQVFRPDTCAFPPQPKPTWVTVSHDLPTLCT